MQKDLLPEVVEGLGDLVVDKIAEGKTKFMGIARLPGHDLHRRLDLTYPAPFHPLCMGSSD